jgi:hypothetical protein
MLLLPGLVACSPALDWREVRPTGSPVALLMPCRPASQARTVRLAGQSVKLDLWACTADGKTWAVAFADVGDPALIGPALRELLASAAANVGAASAPASALKVDGATPNDATARSRFTGRLPDGRAVDEVVAVFAAGTIVHQVTALGDRMPEDAVQTLLESLRVRR